MQVVLARPGDLLIDNIKNPFTPKAYLIRYWSQTIKTNAPQSEFLLSKASPMTAVDAATFAKLAAQNDLSTHLHQFCSAAKLFCFPDLSQSLAKHSSKSSFSAYQEDKNFINYGTGGLGGANSFKNYSEDQNVVDDSFRQYSRNSVGQDARFSSYARQGNLVNQGFDSYGSGGKITTGGSSIFKEYTDGVNVPDLNFNNYGADANGREQSFKAYTNNANGGNETFTSYGKNGNGELSEFATYGNNSNVIQSDFGNYGQNGNGANDTFTSYGFDGNVPVNNFKVYGNNGNGATDSFTSYSAESNVGVNTFDSYGKKSNAEDASFDNYKGGFNGAGSNFTSYGQGATSKKVGFKTYSFLDTFKEYQDKHSISFAKYSQSSSSSSHMGSMNKWVEPGKFFKESMLKQGNVMPMPDIRDKMPQRWFLPKTLLSKLPFSSSRLDEMKNIFHASENSTMEKMIVNSLHECEREPSVGETKRCVGSAEDMIDFATSVLGNKVVVRTTDNTKGSKEDIMIGSVTGINRGKVTKSVSCHQSLYPYLLYYCHSVPKVRVYEADIMDAKTKVKINHGTAICHIDTSAWSSSHGAFLALGSSPGKTEVCHWIFENDLTWTIADN
ncbi:hypothetical protein ACFE04_024621 [Oxalis oulophora]